MSDIANIKIDVNAQLCSQAMVRACPTPVDHNAKVDCQPAKDERTGTKLSTLGIDKSGQPSP